MTAAGRTAGIGRVAIVGAGQVGTMLGVALRSAPRSAGVGRVGLLDRRSQVAVESLSMGGGHEILPNLEAILEADTVILAIPVLDIVNLLDELGSRFRPESLVVDTGSAKRVVVEAMRRSLPESVHRVGGHPMAGTERSGPAGALPDALLGAPFILTPVRQDPRELARARELVCAMGARPVEMDAVIHDQLMARTSHIAHVAAFALAAVAGEADGPIDLSPGFKGATRLAASDPVMVSSFLRANAEEVVAAIDELQGFLDGVRSVLAAEPEQLERFLDEVQRVRERVG